MGNPAPASRKTTTPNPLYDTNATLAALNCSRWKLCNLCKTDPDFPLPRDIAAGKLAALAAGAAQVRETLA